MTDSHTADVRLHPAGVLNETEYQRGYRDAERIYKERAEAWHAVVDVLLRHNRHMFNGCETGQESAVKEIKRLQAKATGDVL